MKKRFLALSIVTVLLLSLLFTGCGAQQEAPAPAPEAPQQVTEPSTEVAQGSFNFVIAHVAGPDTSIHLSLERFAENLMEKSNGQIDAQVYPSAQLGGDRELIEGLQEGNITIVFSSTAPLVPFISDLAIFDLPFLFSSKEIAREVLSGPFFDVISKKYEERGMKLLTFSDSGFRTLTLKGVRVTTPAELRDVNIRTMENQYHMAAWRALGANPTPIPFNELYTALQQNLVQAQENPYELIVSQKFYEQLDYAVTTNHIFQTLNITMNLDTFNSLPADIQTLVVETMQEAVAWQRDFQDSRESEYIQVIQDAGMEVIELTDEQRVPFQELTQGVYEDISNAVDSDVFEALMKAVEDAQ